ncbi:MAG: orotidine-5'-phosphate decarboxylase [Synergistaceae bacterium]|jgi:orotidine-5'-phosphate decarboxylase|nr:orotidine-5'-phosphate decarboxylase [Synergistaceae bacterium]
MRIDRLVREIRRCGNPAALGLDTRAEFVPEGFSRPLLKAGAQTADVVFAFNAALLDGLRDIIPCVKIQAAYYELLGPGGMLCLRKTLDEAQRLGYVTITDAKRGDIGATASAYASAYVGPSAQFPSDFVTVNPYLGTDGIKPFIKDCGDTGRGIFVLVKTSNPSSGEFQDLTVSDGRTLYEHVADKVSLWGDGMIGEEGYSSVGAVVGATYPVQGAALRRRMPHTFFLLPGYGAQGASAAGLAGCFDDNGGGAVVNASRSILCAYKKNASGESDFVGAAREEALRMRDDLRHALGYMGGVFYGRHG